MCQGIRVAISTQGADLLTVRRVPGPSLLRRSIVIRRPVTCAGHCNLRRVCGFPADEDIPSESTLSRAFAEFAGSGLGGRVHDALVKEYLAEELVGHISRDSTAIIGREKPAKKVVTEQKKIRKRGRPAKGEQREPAVEKRLDR